MHIYWYMCVDYYACMYVYIYWYVCVCIYRGIYVCICIYLLVYMMCVYWYGCVGVCICWHVCMCLLTHTCTGRMLPGDRTASSSQPPPLPLPLHSPLSELHSHERVQVLTWQRHLLDTWGFQRLLGHQHSEGKMNLREIRQWGAK